MFEEAVSKRGRRLTHSPPHLLRSPGRTTSHAQNAVLSIRGPLHQKMVRRRDKRGDNTLDFWVGGQLAELPHFFSFISLRGWKGSAELGKKRNFRHAPAPEEEEEEDKIKGLLGGRYGNGLEEEEEDSCLVCSREEENEEI